MVTPSVAKLGHLGLYVKDLEREKAFYRDVLGLRVTDEDLTMGVVFLSARPEDEHHELALFAGRNAGSEAHVVQQLSFRCNSIDDVIGYYKRFREQGVKIDLTATHGNALSIYCFDPENNRCEVYWNTGLRARQPYLERVDLDKPRSEILAQVEQSVSQHAERGFVDMEAMAVELR